MKSVLYILVLKNIPNFNIAPFVGSKKMSSSADQSSVVISKNNKM